MLAATLSGAVGLSAQMRLGPHLHFGASRPRGAWGSLLVASARGKMHGRPFAA